MEKIKSRGFDIKNFARVSRHWECACVLYVRYISCVVPLSDSHNNELNLFNNPPSHKVAASI